MIKTEVADVEREIDEALRSLLLFQAPRYQLISAILWYLELALHDSDRTLGRRTPAGHVNLLNYKPATALLVATAWQVAPINEEQLVEPQSLLGLVNDATNFALVYGLLADIFPGYHQGELTAEVINRTVRFSFTSERYRIHDALNFPCQVYKRMYPPERREDVARIRSLDDKIRLAVANDFEESAWPPQLSISDETFGLALDQANAETSAARFPESLSCGTYSVAMFRSVIVALRAISHIAHSAWSTKQLPAFSDDAVWGPVVWFNGESLLGLVSSLSKVSLEMVRLVIDELTFRPEAAQGDLEINPIIQQAEQLWIAPHIFLTYRWEDNLARLWNAKYPSEYGRTVGREKRNLSNELASAFANRGFIVSTPDRAIRDESGRTLTDVDVAVVSPSESILLLLEAKWPVSPSNAKETAKADTEVEEGFQQLELARREIARRGPAVLRQLFPNQAVETWNLSESHCIAIVRGLYPSASVSMQFPVVPADPALDYLYNVSGESLKSVVRDLEDPPENRLLSGVKEFDKSVAIAGWQVVTPQWSWDSVLGAAPPAETIKAGRNSACPCGSGKKFKKCCQLATRSNYYVERTLIP